jgi:hypothetical protein
MHVFFAFLGWLCVLALLFLSIFALPYHIITLYGVVLCFALIGATIGLAITLVTE